MTPGRLDRGLVCCLDGVGGYNWGPRWLRGGLLDAGVACAITIFDWGYGPKGMFIADLVAEEKNKRRAAELAAMVENYERLFPGRPVYLIGHSAGAGMVVFALEQMADETRVDDVFLLAPALDPERNLAPALRHVRSRCFATYSPADVALMGLGTSVFATLDRKHTLGAGLVGFKLPQALSPEDGHQYRKLRQAGWDTALLKKGLWGGHMGWSSPRFACEYIAPVLRGDEAPAIFQPLATLPSESTVGEGTTAQGESEQ